ncbi:MAG: type II toxin-antitoxin system VapC family toxin [Nanoarchaeota archaeon]
MVVERRATLRAGEIAGTLIKQGQQIEGTDALIAAIALTNGISEIITANKDHYERIPGIKVVGY